MATPLSYVQDLKQLRQSERPNFKNRENHYLGDMRLPQHIVEEQERHHQEDELLLTPTHRVAVNRGRCLVYRIANTLRSTNFCDSFLRNLSVENDIIFQT